LDNFLTPNQKGESFAKVEIKIIYYLNILRSRTTDLPPIPPSNVVGPGEDQSSGLRSHYKGWQDGPNSRGQPLPLCASHQKGVNTASQRGPRVSSKRRANSGKQAGCQRRRGEGEVATTWGGVGISRPAPIHLIHSYNW